ncbi:MAG: HAMP domain-containing protein [Chromatiales bacterium]|nr:MAG: HAMP domain-containing protein [Chromatiales bacterium]
MSNRQASIPLQSKVSLTLVLLIAAFVILSYTILQSVIAPAFDELEIDAAKSDLHRAEAALRNDIENIEAITADWGPWDDMYSYVTGTNPGFEKSNLNRPTLANLDLDLLVVYSAESHFLWGQFMDGGVGVSIETLQALIPDETALAALSSHDEGSDRTAGFVQSTRGPMMISSRAVRRSDESGPIAGAVVMGQFLNDEHLARYRERTDVDISLGLADAGADIALLEGFEFSTATVNGAKILFDINNQPFLILQTQTPRSISYLGSQTINAAMLFIIVAGAMVCGFIWFTLRYTILRPIEKLSMYIDEIRSSGDLSRQLSMQRGDEIGVLGRQFDNMTAEVHNARQALLDQSLKAGKADTAAEVMHNIRNAMTPMINGLDRLRKSLRVTGNLRIAESTKQIADPNCPPERKQKFLEYIVASFEHIEIAANDSIADLDLVTSQAKQVAGILTDQEKFANVAPVAENVTVDDVLGEAANIIPRENPKTVELTLASNLNKLRVRAHRIGLLQVMGNLILNAYESIKRSGTPHGKILLLASNEMVDDKPMVRVTVRDNGSGFNDDTEPMIFRRGFTSKSEGEFTGLGLHWCANAVASMGGKISAESDGEGRGAEFHVLLPAAQGGRR